MRNYEATGLKMPRMLFGQFICELQNISLPPKYVHENIGCLDLGSLPTSDLKLFCLAGNRHLLIRAFKEL